jgi:tetratricopeptide (TPR) repeat protein
MLADAYRRSGYALRDLPPEAGDPVVVEETSRARFERAAALFAELLDQLAALEAHDELLALYDRLALFYQADCLFELNDPQQLPAARELYHRAAARYERTPAALVAQVQLANIALRLGDLTEAARAVERAYWLLRNIPDEAFADAVYGADRAHWERYLNAISGSELFRSVLARAR